MTLMYQWSTNDQGRLKKIEMGLRDALRQFQSVQNWQPGHRGAFGNVQAAEFVSKLADQGVKDLKAAIDEAKKWDAAVRKNLFGFAQFKFDREANDEMLHIIAGTRVEMGRIDFNLTNTLSRLSSEGYADLYNAGVKDLMLDLNDIHKALDRLYDEYDRRKAVK